MAAEEYFDRIRDCWSPLADAGKIIPFCTPVARSPSALVVGTNHSWFDPDQTVAEKIATDFPERTACGLPTLMAGELVSNASCC